MISKLKIESVTRKIERKKTVAYIMVNYQNRNAKIKQPRVWTQRL